MTKTELRRMMRQRKQTIAREVLDSLSANIVEALCQIQEWKSANTVLLYYSLPDEVATHSLVVTAAAEGKTVLLPRVVGDDLTLHRYDGDDSLRLGAFGIQESAGPIFDDYEKIDLAIVPGVAFTIRGERLGRGRGYYDRLLPRLPRAKKIGLCWPLQIVEELPTDAHDMLMDVVFCG